MKNKKGFTLIELLAVIVILAIIALIATPIVLSIIKDSKESTNKRSVELYAEAVKQAASRYQIENPSSSVAGNYTQLNSGRTLDGVVSLNVDYDGDVECSTVEISEDGKVSLDGCIVNGDSDVYSYSEGNVKTTEISKTLATGSDVYFDVVKGTACTEKEYKTSWDSASSDYLNSKAGYNGINNVNCYNSFSPSSSDCKYNTKLEKQNSCLKFYVFYIDDSTVKMILDHNTTSIPEYDHTDYGYYGSYSSFNLDYVLSLLNKDTRAWNGVITKRLLSFNDIVNITGNNLLDESQTNNSYTLNSISWLYDRIDSGYWISSSNNWYVIRDRLTYMILSYKDMVGGGIITGDEVFHVYRAPITVRPVIEVSKQKVQ